MSTEISKSAVEDEFANLSRGDLRFFRSCLGNIQKSIRERKGANKLAPSLKSMTMNCASVVPNLNACEKVLVSPKSLCSDYLSDSAFGETIDTRPIVENAVQSVAVESTGTSIKFMAMRCAIKYPPTSISKSTAETASKDILELGTPGLVFAAPLGPVSAIRSTPQNFSNSINLKAVESAIPQLDVSATNLNNSQVSTESSNAVGKVKMHSTKSTVNSFLCAIDTSCINVAANVTATQEGTLSIPHRANFVSPRSVKTTGIKMF